MRACGIRGSYAQTFQYDPQTASTDTYTAPVPVCPGCVLKRHRNHAYVELAAKKEIEFLEKVLGEEITTMAAFFEKKEQTLGSSALPVGFLYRRGGGVMY